MAQVEDFGAEHITIRKVPAHRPYAEVLSGLIPYADWYGNQQADAMARWGAEQHPDNSEAIEDEASNTNLQSSLPNMLTGPMQN